MPLSGTLENTESSEDESDGDDRQWKTAKDLLKMFTCDALKRMCSDRGITMSSRGTLRKKSELIECFLGTESRASDEQMGYTVALIAKNYKLVVGSRDIDSKSAASKWIEAAVKAVELKGGRPEDVKQRH